jgi:hypothetical protein
MHKPLLRLVQLPPLWQRTVIQHWRLAEAPVPVVVLRSIEMANGEYYMVARVIDEQGAVTAGGKHGIPLSRISFEEYRQENGVDVCYKITETGELLCFFEGEPQPDLRCIPVSSESLNLGA